MSKTIIGPLQCQFVTVHTPKDFDGDENYKYSIQLIIPKSDKKTIEEVKRAIKTCAENTSWPAAAKKRALQMANNISVENKFSILKDGDLYNEGREAENKEIIEHLKDTYTLKLSRKASFDRPFLCRINQETGKADVPIPTDQIESTIKNASWVYVAFSPWANDKKGYSINTTLDGVVFHRAPKTDENFAASNPFGDNEFEFVPEETELDLDDNPFDDVEESA